MRSCIVGASGKLGRYVVLAPWGVHQYASGTAQAVLDHAPAGARLIFSCGWRRARVVDIADQVEACRRVLASATRWTVVRASDLEEGPSEGLPVWSAHVGDPVLRSNGTRRIDFALFMIEALTNEELLHEAPAIVGCRTPSALAHAASGGGE